jgi:biotin-(acetyl-CoA carboxylase) ligase
VRAALERARRRAALKWPNDLLAPDGSGRKLGGVLTETRSDGGRIVDA